MGWLKKVQSIVSGSDRVNVEKRFEVLRAAVSGTMSDFYMARDRTTGKIVGVKVGDREKVDLFEARFVGMNKPPEGAIASAFDHPNIVKTLEYGMTNKDLPYVVMEFINGIGLHALLQNRDERIADHSLDLMRQMTTALDVVHKSGFIHRDVCPRNFIVLPEMDTIKLIDFGLTVPATSAFMQPGNRTGTPLYMAPEVVRRKKTDQRLDIFSLGVTCYQMFTYELPWEHHDTTGLAALTHDTVAPIPILERVPNLNRTLATAIMSAIEAKLDQRTSSLEILLEQISGVTSAFAQE